MIRSLKKKAGTTDTANEKKIDGIICHFQNPNAIAKLDCARMVAVTETRA
jgi:hypothetical protein